MGAENLALSPRALMWLILESQLFGNMREFVATLIGVTQASRILEGGSWRGYTWVCLESKMESYYIPNRLQCSVNITLLCIGNKT